MLRLCSLLAVIALVVGQPAPAAWSHEKVAQQESNTDDWPQLGHDPQRTNASPATISGPFRFYWRWVGPPIAARVEPGAAGGPVFVGGGRRSRLAAGCSSAGSTA